ncbi:hypothetical protein EDC01DRAFT_427178 [Geopyxis carbonaria]|nr:hypothetical protein EDC01DRAFT_427178 [Geopyxis carbonaria]
MEEPAPAPSVESFPLPPGTCAETVYAAWAVILASHESSESVTFRTGPDRGVCAAVKADSSIASIAASLIPAPASKSDLMSEVIVDASSVSVRLAAGQPTYLSSRLHHVLTQPTSTPVRDLALFSPSDAAIMSAFNAATPVAVQKTLHTLIHTRALTRPNSCAIDAWDGALTYRELDTLSSRLAAHLRTHTRLRPGDTAALCFEKSRWAVVAMLGVAKAGAAWVALDPAYPKARRDVIMEVVNAAVVVASPTQAGLFPAAVVVDTAFFDSCSTECEDGASVPPDATAAVLFTSGSTGRPKGAKLSHSNLTSALLPQGALLGLGAGTRALQFATFTFDASLLEIFTPLLFGGCVCIISETARLGDLPGAINACRANFAFLTTTMAALLAPASVPTLQTLVVGGEVVTRDVVRRWGEGRELVTIYGPSECSVFVLAAVGVTPGANPACLGNPVACRVFVVDPDDPTRLVPVGCEGELIVAGPGVGMGYVGEPEKTAAAWISHDVFGGRAYRTGDIVRYTPAHGMVFVRRGDTQTKIRGQRVELGEIETHLGAQPDILQCGVFHARHGPAKQRIVAVVRFAGSLAEGSGSESASDSGVGSETTSDVGGDAWPVVAAQGSPCFWAAVEEVEAALVKVLPQWMVPNVWIGVPRLPLTFSGKIDRVGLQGWIEGVDSELYSRLVRTDADDADDAEAEEGTEDGLHARLRAIWSTTLGLPEKRIPLDASFFQLGGDSITAMQVASACTKASLPVSVAQIMTSRTIAKLANVIRESAQEQSVQVLLDPPEEEVAWELSPMQTLMMKLQPDGCEWHNQGFLVRLTRSVAPSALAAAMKRIVAAHPMLRARFSRSQKGAWFQRVTADVDGSYICSTHNISSATEIPRLVAQRQQIFSPTSGPLIAADLLLAPGQAQVLFLNAHHLVIDLVSWRIILSDLEELLTAPDPDTVVLAASTSFQAWTRQQRIAALVTPIAATLPFPLPELKDPRAYWGLANRRNLWGDNTQLTFSLSPAHTQALLRADAGPMDVLLSALAASFTNIFTDRGKELLVHTEGHGREPFSSQQDLSRTVGWFTTIYPLLIAAGATPAEVKAMREAIPGNGREYMAALHTHAESEAQGEGYVSPIEVMLNYQGSFAQLHRRGALLERMVEVQIEDSMNSPELQRYAVFEIEAAVEGDRLGVCVIFNRHSERQGQISEWVQEWEKGLEMLLETPGDVKCFFPVCVEDVMTDAELRSITVEHHVTESQICAAWAVVLHWFTQQPTVCFLDADTLYTAAFATTSTISTLALTATPAPDSTVCNTALNTPIMAKHDITLTRTPSHLTLHFAASCFSCTVIDAVAASLETVLTYLNSPLRIDDIPRCALPRPTTPPSRAVTGTVHAAFFTVARKHSDGTAIDAGQTKVSYAQLATDVRRVAGQLQTAGVAAGEVVAIDAAVSTAHIVAALAVSAVGGVFTTEKDSVRVSINASFMVHLNPTSSKPPRPSGRFSTSTTHVALLTAAASAAQVLGLGENTRLLAGPAGSEIAEFCIFAPLLFGGTTVLPPSTAATVAILPPALADTLTLPALEKMVFTSDPALPHQIGRWTAKNVQVYQTFGVPPPGALDVAHPIIANSRPAIKAIPGRTWACELHNSALPAPIGVVGELVTASIGPTGTLVRATKQGTLEFIGHRDTPTTVDGRNVDIFGVERALDAHVMVIDGVLTAFTSAKDTTLPAHLQPTAWHPLTVPPPLTPHGTLDRAALAAKATTLTPRETALAELWATTLGIEPPVSGAASFVHLGGDPFDALTLVSRARDAGWTLPAGAILAAPSLSAMAAAMVATTTTNIATRKPPQPFSLLADEEGTKKILEEKYEYQVERDVADVYPCAPLQEALIALSILHPGSYTARHHYTLPAGIDVARLRAAWEATVARHDVLRTVFVLGVGSQIVQAVLKPGVLPLSWHDTTTDDILAFEYNAPLCRYDVAAGGREFVWSIHHALADGWAFELITSDVAAAYRSATALSMAPVPPPYSAFIQYLQNRDTEASLEFWRERLEGVVPTAWPPTVAGAARGETRKITATVALPRAAVTAATILTAAWGLLLTQLSGSHDVLFGAPVTGRMAVPIDNIEALVGPTIQTLPTRVTTTPETTVSQLLDTIEHDFVAAIPHEHAGFQNIARAVPEAGGFRTMLVVQPPPRELEDGEEEVMRKTEARLEVEYPLTLGCWQRGDKVTLELSFDTKQVSDEMAERTLAQFTTLLSALTVAAPAAKVATLSAFSADDAAQLRMWNTHPPLPPSASTPLTTLLDSHAARTPNALAADGHDGTLTYAQLSSLSTALAHRLVASGVTTDVVVPLVFDKSIYFLVAVYAVWKAGGAYAPLDAGQPKERLAQIVDAVRPHAVVAVASSERAEFTREFTGLPTLTVDGIASTPDDDSTPLPRHDPSAAAYLIFTSGSTGTPKGVVVQHSSLLPSLHAQSPILSCAPTDRVLAFCSYIWDVHVLENILPVLSGSCVVVPSEAERTDALGEVMKRGRVSRAHMSPAVAALLDPATLPELRVLCVGGDVMPRRLIERVAEHPHITLINAYGPTEASITSNMRPAVTADSDPRDIGPALGATGCWITDPANPHTLLPLGAVGELVLSGPTLARGYLDRPTETAAAFITPTWGAQFNVTRAYRTGDLARHTDSGSVLFLGRRDAQVKIHGIRVELGEVEAAIGGECAVELCRPAAGSALLAAFVVWHGEDAEWDAKKAALHANAATKVPAYMVPSLWVPVGTLPQQRSTGKVDRAKLRTYFASTSPRDLGPFSAATVATATRVVEAPQTPLEERLRDLWAGILNIPATDISRGDHFFRLHGDSVAAIRLVSEARRGGLRLTSRAVFETPVLCELAVHLTSATPASTDDGVPAFSLIPTDLVTELRQEAAQQVGVGLEDVDDVLPCTPMQEGLIAASLSDRGSYIVNHTSLLPPSISTARFKAAWQTVVAANPILRTRVIQAQVAGDGFYQCVLAASADACAIAWDEFPESEWEGYMTTVSTIQVASGGALLRFGLCTDGRFVFSAHHALYDAGSLPGVFAHFRSAYAGTPLPPRTPFAAFVRHLTTLPREKSATVWRRLLAGATGSTFPGVSDAPPRAAFFSREVDVPSTTGVYTTSTLLRAAWGLVLMRHTNKTDLCFRETLSGKNAALPGIDALGGPSICSVPFRVSTDDDSTVGGYLRAVNAFATDLMGHEHFGIQHIARLGADAAAAAAFGTLVVIQPTEDGDGSMGHGIVKVASPMKQDIPLILEFTLRSAGRVRLTARYDRNVVGRERIGCVLGHIEAALTQLATAMPDAMIADVGLFTTHDQAWLERLRNPTPPAATESVWKIIAAHAKTTPDAEAVAAHDGSLTYQELVTAVEALAAHLRANGIGADRPVGLCFNKSRWVVVWMLAVLASGAAYVSLDPSSPPARLALIVGSCQPSIVFADPAAVGLFGGDVRVHGVDVNDMPGLIRCLIPPATPAPDVAMDSVAYIIYTSGSTGTPKGVVIPHTALSATAVALARASNFDNTTRTLQFSALTWDAAVFEIYAPLVVGGCVCVPSEDQRINDLAGAFNDLRANADLLMPSVAALLDPADVPGLQTLLLGGEAVAKNDVARWTEAGRDVRIAYGPTEACVVALMSTAHAGADPANLGTPVPGQCSAWIVSAACTLAGVGEVGELVLSGHNLALGYLGDAAKTAGAFFDAPWLAGRSTARCYRTGDLAYYAADGSVVFAGRKDGQVKLRGLRIELGEIEHHLRSQPALARGAVVFPRAGRWGKSIVAVFALADGGDESWRQGDAVQVRKDEGVNRAVGEMRKGVAAAVPGYMVPTTWLCVRAVPVTAIGKVDKRAIQAWVEGLVKPVDEDEDEEEAHKKEDEEREVEKTDETPMRRLLRTIWAEVLDVPERKIGVDTSFFRLGGDSITAIRLVSRCRRSNIAVTSKQIKKLKTIAALESAVSLITPVADADAATTVAVEDVEDVTPFGLTPIQKQHFALAPGGCDAFSQGTLLKVGRKLQDAELRTAVTRVVTHHVMLRARFCLTPGGWVQSIPPASAGEAAFRLTHIAPATLDDARSAAENAQRALSPATGHVLNVLLISTPQGQWMYIAAHHLVVDFVSWSIILRDLEATLHSPSAPLQAVPLQFRDWQAQLATHALSLRPVNIPSTDLDFWGIDNAAAVTYGSRRTHNFRLPRAATDALDAYAHRHNTDTLSVLLAALAASFWTTFPERKELGLFLEHHGRDTRAGCDADLSRTVGWFTTFYPLLCNPPSPSARAVADLVAQFVTAREAVSDPHAFLAAPGAAELAPLEVVVNHFGAVDGALSGDGGLLQVELETDFTVLPAEMRRVGLFEVGTQIEGGCLVASFAYDVNMNSGKQQRIGAWARGWERELRGIEREVQKKERIEEEEDEMDKIQKEENTELTFPLLPGRTPTDMAAIISAALQPAAAVESIYPATPLQTGMCLSQLSHPASYNIVITWRVTATNDRVDTARLNRAWAATVRRHAMLRTVFISDPSGVDPVLQVVLRPDADLPTPDDDGTPPVPLGETPRPPYRFSVAGNEVRFECSHAIYDSYSNGVLLRDLATAYAADTADSADATTDTDTAPAPGFGRFVAHLQSLDMAAAKAYWTGYLKDAEITHFPALAPSTMTECEDSTGIASHTFTVPDGEGAIAALCRANDTTAAVVFKFLWALTLRVYTSNAVVCFGSLLDGRDPDFPGVDEIVGPVIATMVVKAALALDKLVLQALGEMAEAEEDGADYQRVGLPTVEQWCGFAGVGLVNTVMSFYMEAVHSSDGAAKGGEGGIRFEHVGGSDKTEYPVVLKVMKRRDSFNVQIDYHTTHLTAAQAGDVQTLMETLITRLLAATASTTISELLAKSPTTSTDSTDCCQVLSPVSPTLFHPRGCLGPLVIRNPHSDTPFATGNLARLSPSGHGMLDVRPAEEFTRVRGATLDLVTVEAAFASPGRVVVVPIATPTTERVVRAAVYVAFPQQPTGAWAREMRASAVAKLPVLYQHLLSISRLIPVLGVDTLTRATVLAIVTGRIVDKTLIIGEAVGSAQTDEQNTEPQQPTAMETVLTEVWKKVLCVKRVKAGANFFDLGGDSLSAMQLVQVAKRRGCRIAHGDVLRFPVLETMAERLSPIEAPTAAAAAAAAVTTITKPFALAPRDLDVGALERQLGYKVADVYPANFFQRWSMPQSLSAARSCLAHFIFDLPTASVPSDSHFSHAAKVFTDRNEMMRTIFLPSGHQAVLGAASYTPATTTGTTTTATLEADTTEYIETHGALSSWTEPIVRFHLLRHTDGAATRLLLRITHAQFDGLSMFALMSELQHAFAAPSAAPAPPRRPSMAALASAVHALSTAPSTVSFWARILAGTRGMTPVLPTPPPAGHVRDVQTTWHPLPGLTDTAFAPLNATFSTALKTVWAGVLSQHTGQTDVVFASLVSARTLALPGDADAHDVLGCCINLVPVVARFPATDSLLPLLASLQDQHAATMPLEATDYTAICDAAAWPVQGRALTSVVQHQNMAQVGDELEGGWRFHQRQPRAAEFDVWVISFTNQKGEMEVGVAFDASRVQKSVAEGWGESVVEGLRALAECAGVAE